jgi:hypothetical protein
MSLSGQSLNADVPRTRALRPTCRSLPLSGAMPSCFPWNPGTQFPDRFSNRKARAAHTAVPSARPSGTSTDSRQSAGTRWLPLLLCEPLGEAFGIFLGQSLSSASRQRLHGTRTIPVRRSSFLFKARSGLAVGVFRVVHSPPGAPSLGLPYAETDNERAAFHARLFFGQSGTGVDGALGNGRFADACNFSDRAESASWARQWKEKVVASC